jgi:DNA-binding CsgD family transcriptional regulator
MMAEGASNAEIAARLWITEGTVKTHVKHILRKLRASNRTQAASMYLLR